MNGTKRFGFESVAWNVSMVFSLLSNMAFERDTPKAPRRLRSRAAFISATHFAGISMQSKDHWEHVYSTKKTDGVSWFQEHAERSMRLIRDTGVPCSAEIIDVGGGASTL